MMPVTVKPPKPIAVQEIIQMARIEGYEEKKEKKEVRFGPAPGSSSNQRLPAKSNGLQAIKEYSKKPGLVESMVMGS
jgi:hypothetical protein